KIREVLESGLGQFKPKLSLRSVAKQKKALILVTKESHCLRDLLYLQELGELPIEIPAVVSNHSDLKTLVESHGIKFIDQSKLDKTAAEAEIAKLVTELDIDLVVLARYMQILTKEFCEKMIGRIINIHHSFLPGFKGAKPYHQAHARGVKIIGATAHFVTPDLDEGPIIDQDVAHVTHASTPEDLIATGRDIERRVLSRAVRDFAEDRIFIVGDKTVVFHN
ncbi:MAG: formyltetrahydrofolate deformylase, partial [Actinobacteria bacterium]|nr:formyltetrahydrofolate deformylase [Actinomycetota bacterium]